jgi:hypothetical protein
MIAHTPLSISLSALQDAEEIPCRNRSLRTGHLGSDSKCAFKGFVEADDGSIEGNGTKSQNGPSISMAAETQIDGKDKSSSPTKRLGPRRESLVRRSVAKLVPSDEEDREIQAETGCGAALNGGRERRIGMDKPKRWRETAESAQPGKRKKTIEQHLSCPSTPIKEKVKAMDTLKSARHDPNQIGPNPSEDQKFNEQAKFREGGAKQPKAFKAGKTKMQEMESKRNGPAEAREAKKRARSNREMENRILSKKLAEQVCMTLRNR